MFNLSKQAVFEDLWEQMEELSKSCDKADGKLSRAIARQLVSYNDLPKSYRIRAHMALTSVLCAQDTLRDAEKDYAEVQARVSAGLHAHLQAELHAELRAIREAYEKDAAEEWTANLQDESIENMTAAAQLSAGSQEDPIDLTLEDDSDTSDNTSDNSFNDSGYEEATDVLSARSSLPPDSMIGGLANSSSSVPLHTSINNTSHPNIDEITNNDMKSSDHDGRLTGGVSVKGGLSAQHAYDLHPQGHIDHANEEIKFSNIVFAGHK